MEWTAENRHSGEGDKEYFFFMTRLPLQHRRFGLPALVVVLVRGTAVLALAHSALAASPARQSAAGATVQVTIHNFAFAPQKITIAPGTTVVWTQKTRCSIP